MIVKRLSSLNRPDQGVLTKGVEENEEKRNADLSGVI